MNICKVFAILQKHMYIQNQYMLTIIQNQYMFIIIYLLMRDV